MADPTNKSYDGIISWAKASDNDIKAKQLATARNITITNNGGTSVVATAGSFDGTGTATIKLKDPVAINVTGNVTGNCSGSSGSCTGNSATASAVKASRTTYSGNRPLALTYIDGITTTTDVTKAVLYSNNFYANPNTGVLTATGGFNGNATSATTATKGDTIQVNGVDSTSAYPISLTNNSVVYTGNYYALQRAVNTSVGGSGLTCIPGAAVAANTEGTTTLVVGNSLAKASAENRTGNIRLYGNNTGYTTIKPSYNSTGNITLTLPSSGGTVALTSDIEQTITDLLALSWCTTAATTTNYASSTNPCVVVEQKYNSTSKFWYRKWSDGWIENGGYITCSGGNGSDYTFYKAFSSTNYSIIGGQHITTGTADNGNPATFYKVSASKFRIAVYGGGKQCFFYACGY